MGKHSRRKSGYLPKVAAGAAPVALLFAAPATALAAQDLTLPLDGISLPVDHQHAGSLEGDGLAASRRDVVTKQIGEARAATDLAEAAGVSPVGAFADRSGRHDVRLGQVTAVTANEQRMAAAATDLTRLGTGERTHHGVWLGNGVDVLSENAEQVDTGLRPTGRFTGDLAGGLAVRRSSGQAVDLGGLGAVGTSSEQHGQFTGDLDFGQQHEAGGQLGPAAGLVKASHDLSSGSISGDLGVDHVIHAEGAVTSVRGTLTPSFSGSLLDRPL
ncbi:hypothetical protein M8542_29935 [Amycolatopsis sp. OK19-0408]|uniref:Uncharacterized protein n=1 Tax=Amycolatopsis iheyensis TaxID=2945988 RepID=A0A9X2SMC4_9PSEU|nr:hypothetical protein [Amycolatopsis iheyensis]MCR6487058.1 hypothetical protein [Amycolatopsis iheyensis]